MSLSDKLHTTELSRMIKESLLSHDMNRLNSNDMFLVEGLDLDTKRRKIYLNSSHNKGINFSLKSNPTFYQHNGINVISIFKRTPLGTPYGDDDGNPFIHALKHEKGWTFEISEAEVYDYINTNMVPILRKIRNHYDTIIMIPSTHDINEKFMNGVVRCLKIRNVYRDVFVKSSKKNAWESIDIEEIEKFCGEEYPKTADIMYDTIMNKINADFLKIKGPTFESKCIDKEYIRFIHDIISLNHAYDIATIAPQIDGKDVLILDDTISSGATISSGVIALKEMFSPKSLTVITLLSEKFKK